ncbi:hypothetical protein CBS101457_006619 [Exobasidium rhododendri]|nr:hypothetical protein CBS101457_006619 [Exobasidium rhododendri]
MSAPYTSQPFGSQSQSSQRRRRPRCPHCGSKRFRRDPSTSLVVCDSGHVLQGFRDEEAQDGDEFNGTRSQLHRRNLKRQDRVGRRGRKKMSVKTTGVWYGARSRFLYFQTLQLILRMQIQALLLEMPGLPAEIEPICRDLWALYVSQKTNLVAQPYLEQENGETDTESYEKTKILTLAAAAQRSAHAERERILEEEWEESESIRERLLDAGVYEEREDLASQSDATTTVVSSSGWESAATGLESDEDDGKMDSFKPKKRRRRRKKGQENDRIEGKILKRQARDDLDDLLAILHLAMISLRVPVMWIDLCTLIKAGKLPYLNVIHQLPAEMVRPFPAREVRKLDPSRIPIVSGLHRRTVALATDLYDNCGIDFPELNVLPIIWKLVERMLLPRKYTLSAQA